MSARVIVIAVAMLMLVVLVAGAPGGKRGRPSVRSLADRRTETEVRSGKQQRISWAAVPRRQMTVVGPAANDTDGQMRLGAAAETGLPAPAAPARPPSAYALARDATRAAELAAAGAPVAAAAAAVGDAALGAPVADAEAGTRAEVEDEFENLTPLQVEALLSFTTGDSWPWWCLEDATWAAAAADVAPADAEGALRTRLGGTALPAAHIAPRRIYSLSVKAAIVACFTAAVASGLSERAAAEKVRAQRGWEAVTRIRIKAWAAALAKQTLAGVSAYAMRKKQNRGYKGGTRGILSMAFEAAVLSHLIVYEVPVIAEGESFADLKARTCKVLANVIFDPRLVRKAAKLVAAQPEFADDKDVQGCMFSRKWVSRFLERAALLKRRVTAGTPAKMPSEPEVHVWQKEFQEVAEGDGFKGHPERVAGADETGICVVSPKYQWVPSGADRATLPGPESKMRITLMITALLTGHFAPHFLILDCAAKGFDLSGTTILTTLLQTTLTAADGWVPGVWRARLLLPQKGGPPVLTDCVFPYLRNINTGAIVTLQKKAWMDTARMCMYVDLVLGPYAKMVHTFCCH